MNCLQQQDRFDAFMHEFNTERPHEALAMTAWHHKTRSPPLMPESTPDPPPEALPRKSPAELYVASPRRYHGLPDLNYPFHDRDILVTACGRICLYRKKINISSVLAGQ